MQTYETAFYTKTIFEVFEQYTETIWPVQVVIDIAAAIAFYLIFKPSKYSNKVISGILALFWLWMGIVYHWSFLKHS